MINMYYVDLGTRGLYNSDGKKTRKRGINYTYRAGRRCNPRNRSLKLCAES